MTIWKSKHNVQLKCRSFLYPVYVLSAICSRVCRSILVSISSHGHLSTRKSPEESIRPCIRSKTRRHGYEHRLKILKWATLEKRRHYISLVECYKTIFGLNGLNFNDFFELALDTRTRTNHPFKFFVKSAEVNPYKYSFFVRIVKDWNNLPLHVVEANSFNIFKTKLKSFLNL